MLLSGEILLPSAREGGDLGLTGAIEVSHFILGEGGCARARANQVPKAFGVVVR